VPSLEVSGFQIDDRNTPKLRRHEVSVREAYEVLWECPRAFRNHSRGAPWILVGPTFGGRMITLPLDPTDERGIWRPRTGYDSSAKEKRRYARE
jgi:hypothetical protein